jgi:hypothetical protein
MYPLPLPTEHQPRPLEQVIGRRPVFVYTQICRIESHALAKIGHASRKTREEQGNIHGLLELERRRHVGSLWQLTVLLFSKPVDLSLVTHGAGGRHLVRRCRQQGLVVGSQGKSETMERGMMHARLRAGDRTGQDVIAARDYSVEGVQAEAKERLKRAVQQCDEYSRYAAYVYVYVACIHVYCIEPG